jgi:membrane-associated protease RseP (regulator of RpoE activity)
MQSERKEDRLWSRLLWILLLLLPLAILFLMPGGGLLRGGIWFLVTLLISVWLIWAILGAPEKEKRTEPEMRMLDAKEEPGAVREVMDIRVATEEAGIKVFHGKLSVTPAIAYEKLKLALRGSAVPMVREDDNAGAAILLVPDAGGKSPSERPIRPLVHWLLFGLTLLTTTWAGAAHQGIDLLREPGRFAVGLPYALGLMAILGVHKLGHYFTARRHGMRVTPPYFIPVPFALGTFGAFIQMRSPAENRRALFDVAVAGPLAGLVLAIPALLIGLRSSVVLAASPSSSTEHMIGVSAGSSLLFALLSKLVLGNAVGLGHVLRLSPLAFAGWLGLLVTALNLLPIGQLDGGHMARAMFGTRTGSTISSVSLWSLFLLAMFVWPGLLMWAIIVFFIAGTGASPLEDVTSLAPWRRRVGYLTFAILVAILLPLPHALWQAAGIHCPYV